MVDTHRLQTTSGGMLVVAELTGRLARRSEGVTSVLEVATYLPMDVESVARALEGVETLDDVEEIEQRGLKRYAVSNGGLVRGGRARDESEEALVEDSQEVSRTVGALKENGHWLRTVREQHELLHLVAKSGKEVVELSYLEGRATVSRARIQRLLNDFDAAGYIEVEYDEDVGELSYRFPPLEYGEGRWKRNMEAIDEAEPPVSSKRSLWGALAIFAAVILVIMIVAMW